MPTGLFVPGRIEVLGKHIDYAGGSSLLIAVDRGFTFHAQPLAGDRIVIRAEESGDEASYAIHRQAGSTVALPVAEPAEGDAPADVGRGIGGSGPSARPGWARYADGVLDRLAAEFGDGLRGARIRFTSTLPAAAGLSSSSALVTGIFLALDAVCRFSELPAFQSSIPNREALATWLSAAEMGGPVGTRGGSEDHTAILLARPGRAIRYGLAPVRYRGSAPVPEGWTFAVGVSGVVADKGGEVQAHYNRLSDLAADAAGAWAAGARPRVGDGVGGDRVAASKTAGAEEPLNLGAALETGAPAEAILDAIRRGAPTLGLDPGPLVRRARHFLEEQALVDAAFYALDSGNVPAFADAANRSAEIGTELLENQVPETLALARLAREIGAPAASPFGAGFGGSVWALVREEDASAFLEQWRSAYVGAFPTRRGAAEFFTTPASHAARSATAAVRSSEGSR